LFLSFDFLLTVDGFISNKLDSVRRDQLKSSIVKGTNREEDPNNGNINSLPNETTPIGMQNFHTSTSPPQAVVDSADVNVHVQDGPILSASRGINRK